MDITGLYRSSANNRYIFTQDGTSVFVTEIDSNSKHIAKGKGEIIGNTVNLDYESLISDDIGKAQVTLSQNGQSILGFYITATGETFPLKWEKLNDTPKSAVVGGEYFWELLFSYDNSDNNGAIIQELDYKKAREISYKEILNNKYNIKYGFKLDTEFNLSLKFLKILNGSTSVKFSHHLDVARDISRMVETGEKISEETQVRRKYTISGGGKLEIYRLCYVTDGTIVKTDIEATSPDPNLEVRLLFSLDHKILGLSNILDLFLETTPGLNNRTEWRNIRSNIVTHSDESDEERFLSFVFNLSNIIPEQDNRAEWADIRNTCNQILNDWNIDDKQKLFQKLLTQFKVTIPGKYNMEEWKKIREESERILDTIEPIF